MRAILGAVASVLVVGSAFGQQCGLEPCSSDFYRVERTDKTMTWTAPPFGGFSRYRLKVSDTGAAIVNSWIRVRGHYTTTNTDGLRLLIALEGTVSKDAPFSLNGDGSCFFEKPLRDLSASFDITVFCQTPVSSTAVEVIAGIQSNSGQGKIQSLTAAIHSVNQVFTEPKP